ncbi:hypothetical protein BH18THE2_BH18THE2_35330 [soil metagenome]
MFRAIKIYLELPLLNMGSQETAMNQTAAMEFIIGGSLSSMKMAANCIIDSQAMKEKNSSRTEDQSLEDHERYC